MDHSVVLDEYKGVKMVRMWFLVDLDVPSVELVIV